MKDALARKWISGIVVGSGFMPTIGGTMTGQLLSAVGTAGAPGIAGAGDADTGMNWPAANTLAWSTNGLERMRLDSTGNVGIGTSSPGYKLDVSATGNISGQFKTSGSINALFLADAGTTPESLYIGTVGNDFRVVAGSNEIMRLTSAGNVGISTSSPSAKLDVAGGGAGAMRLRANGSGVALIQFTDDIASGDQAYMGLAAANTLAFYTSGQAERMRIDNVGQVGIGLTTPANKLEVFAGALKVSEVDTVGGKVILGDAGTTTANVGMYRGLANSLSVGNYLNLDGYDGISLNTGAAAFGAKTSRMLIDATGNVGIGNAGPVNKLDIANAGAVTARVWNTTSSADALFSATNTVGAALFGINATGPYIYTAAALPILFYNSGSERARFDTSGNLLLGLTAAGTTAAKTIQIANGTAPTANVAGGQIYVEAGALKYRGSSGTVTTLAAA